MANAVKVSLVSSLVVAVVAGILGVASTVRVDRGYFVVEEDRYGMPTGRVFAEPGLHYSGLTTIAHKMAIVPWDITGSVVVTRNGENLKTSYRMVMPEFKPEQVPSLMTGMVYGEGRMSAIIEAALQTEMGEWAASGSPDAKLGEAVAARIVAEITARGVPLKMEDVPRVTVSIIGTERLPVPVPVTVKPGA